MDTCQISLRSRDVWRIFSQKLIHSSSKCLSATCGLASICSLSLTWMTKRSPTKLNTTRKLMWLRWTRFPSSTLKMSTLVRWTRIHNRSCSSIYLSKRLWSLVVWNKLAANLAFSVSVIKWLLMILDSVDWRSGQVSKHHPTSTILVSLSCLSQWINSSEEKIVLRSYMPWWTRSCLST